MTFDDNAVAEIERLFADLSVPLTEIALRFDCSAMKITRLAQERGWPSRTELRGRRVGPRRGKVPKAHTTLMMRLCRAATKQLEQMENAMETGDMSAADHERLAKSVSAMIGGMQKVAAVHDGGDGKTKPAAGKDRTVPDVERRRHEIAERLERLVRERAARERPDEPR